MQNRMAIMDSNGTLSTNTMKEMLYNNLITIVSSAQWHLQVNVSNSSDTNSFINTGNVGVFML